MRQVTTERYVCFPGVKPMQRRRDFVERALAVIDVSSMVGLEIGPLANPTIRKDQGSVKYVDVASAEELKVKYSGNQQMQPRLDHIVEVDYILREDQTLPELVNEDAPFDYVLAAHVIEHVPDTIGWLAEMSAILKPGGILSLVVPDRRFTFDVNRRNTDIGDLVDAHLRGSRQPSYRDIYDWFSSTVTVDGMVDTEGLWSGNIDYAGIVRTDVTDPDVDAYHHCLARREGQVFDLHCHTFTPTSFLTLYEKLVRLNLTDFEVASFFPTNRNELEFHVSLRKLPVGGDPEARRGHQLASIPEHDEIERPVRRASRHRRLTRFAFPEIPPGSRATDMPVSSLERQLILWKRQVMAWLRACSTWRRSRA
jgi:SAM-dependent methyltransferase